MPYIAVYYRILSYITLIRNRSLLAKLVEIGRRVGGITGVSYNRYILLISLKDILENIALDKIVYALYLKEY